MSEISQGLQYGILGPVVIWNGKHEVGLTARPSRALLARLLLAAEHAVHIDLVVDSVYGSMPPKSARNQIQKSASELRSKGALIEERNGAYLLHSSPEAVDAHRYSDLVARARTLTDASQRAQALRRAEQLWRGPAFTGLDDYVFRSAAAEWDEKRLVAIADRIEAEMLGGQHRQVIPELRRLILEHPTNEAFHALFMIACHHAGRVSEAVRSYSDLRRQLADELGIDPPVMLQQLHQMILRQDRALSRISTLREVEGLGVGVFSR